MPSTASRVFRAPGRVNLIGEHTDYNEGFVFPAAIDRYIRVEAMPRDDQRVTVRSEGMPGEAEFALQSERAGDWADYVRGVASLLAARGLAKRGADLAIRSTLPVGGGLSSSAALEVGAALALLGVNGEKMPLLELAQLCQRAEHEFALARCGIMDQFIVTHAVERTALMLDCRSLEYRHVPLPDPAEIRLVVSNTMVKHELAGSAYNERRQECEEAARLLGVASLRDVTRQQFSAREAALPEPVRSRARHVIDENARVLAFAMALQAGNWRAAGALMAESHASLRDFYQVSCEELDFQVETARALGSIGSRMTGGGFGGCTIHFVPAARAESFCRELVERYATRFGFTAQTFLCAAAGAAGEEGLRLKA